MKPSTYARRHTLTLPSGAKFVVRRPSALSLIESGGFPAELTVQMWSLVSEKGLDPAKLLEDAKGLSQWAHLIDTYIPHVAVLPKIVTDRPTELEEGDDGFLTGVVNIADMPDTDKQQLLLYGNYAVPSDEEREAPVKALTPFREGVAREDSGRGSEEVRAEAVSIDRPTNS